MSKRKWKNKRKNISQTNSNTLIVEKSSLNLSEEARPKDEYFLGFRRMNFNGLWKWDTLEDVKF